MNFLKLVFAFLIGLIGLSLPVIWWSTHLSRGHVLVLGLGVVALVIVLAVGSRIWDMQVAHLRLRRFLVLVAYWGVIVGNALLYRALHL